jgi:hypothetical protein
MTFLLGLILGIIGTSAVWYLKGESIKGFIDGLLRKK